MLCPHCSASLKYRERSNQTCSSCYKVFAFEPKTHSLGLSDTYFRSAVQKLSNNNRLFFTSQQLQFAVSRKKMKPGGFIVVLIVVGIISTVIVSTLIWPFGIALFFFWLFLIVFLKIFYKPTVSLPQSAVEFERSVLSSWCDVYGQLPSDLVMKFAAPGDFENPKGILICESIDAVMCLNANNLGRNLSLVIDTRPQKAFELIRKHGKLPVYVLHDASVAGVGFFEKVKEHLRNQAPVIDIGLRPENLLKSNFPKMRENGLNADHLKNLTAEERDWLNRGYFVPLYVLRPEKLIQYVKKHVEKKGGSIKETDEKRARNIGFMTWVNE